MTLRIDQAILSFLDLAYARVQAHQEPGKMLAEKFRMIVRADRSAEAFRFPLLDMYPDPVVPLRPQVLTGDREIPLNLSVQVQDRNEGRGYRDCLELAGLVQAAMLIDPETGVESGILGEDNPPAVGFSVTSGTLYVPQPIGEREDLFISRAVVTGRVEVSPV